MAPRRDEVHFSFHHVEPDWRGELADRRRAENRRALREYAAHLRARPDEMAFQEAARAAGRDSSLDPLPEGYT